MEITSQCRCSGLLNCISFPYLKQNKYLWGYRYTLRGFSKLDAEFHSSQIQANLTLWIKSIQAQANNSVYIALIFYSLINVFLPHIILPHKALKFLLQLLNCLHLDLDSAQLPKKWTSQHCFLISCACLFSFSFFLLPFFLSLLYNCCVFSAF